MDYFQRLGRRVESEWRAQNYNEERLADIAHRALTEDPAHLHVSPHDILRWLQSDAEVPAQFAPQGTFGQPPVTLYRSGRFIVDALFWLDATTSIHEHSFSGAFQVLAGGSVHGTYGFELDERINENFLVGRSRIQQIELLRVGDTRRILAGNRFIHALFHLERPSVTIVVRSDLEASRQPQYEYLRPHLARASFYEENRTRRRLEALAVVREMDAARFREDLLSFVETQDLYSVFQALLRLASIDRPDELETLLSRARKRHGAVVEAFPPVLRELDRMRRITDRRKHVHGAEHRFLLAVLLNAPGRQQVLDLVKARVPGGDPVDTIIGWVRELAAQPSPMGGAEPNALGVQLDGSADDVFAHVAHGLTVPQLLEAMRRDYGDAEIEAHRGELERFHHAFRKFPLFATLFREE